MPRTVERVKKKEPGYENYGVSFAFEYWRDLLEAGVITAHNQIVIKYNTLSKFRNYVRHNFELREVIRNLHSQLHDSEIIGGEY